MNASQFIADQDIEVAVSVEVTKGWVGTFDLEVGKGDPIQVHQHEGRGRSRPFVAEHSHGRGRLVDALVAFFVGDGQVEEAISIEVVERRVGASSQVNHPSLQVVVRFKRPRRGVLGAGVSVEMNAFVVVRFQGSVGREQEVSNPVLVHVDVIRSGKPREVHGLVTVEACRKGGVHKRCTVEG